MANIRGIDFNFQIDVGATATTIGARRSCSLSFTHEPSVITHAGGNSWSARVAGIRDWSGEFDCVYDDADGVQDEVITDFDTDPPATSDFTGTGGAHVFAGLTYITEFSYEAAIEDALGLSGSFVGAGECAIT